MLKRKRYALRNRKSSLKRSNKLIKTTKDVFTKQKNVIEQPKYITKSKLRCKTVLFLNKLAKAEESEPCNKGGILLKQNNVTLSHRAILFDWLIQVGQVFMLTKKTIFLSMQIIDRVGKSDFKIDLSTYQLLGIAALYMCSKTTEVIFRKPEQYIKLLDGVSSVNELYNFEKIIIENIGYKALCKDTIFDYAVYYFDDVFKSLKAVEKENLILSQGSVYSDLSLKYSISPDYIDLITKLSSVLQIFVFIDSQKYLPREEIALYAVWNVCKRVPAQFKKKLAKIKRIIKRNALSEPFKYICKQGISCSQQNQRNLRENKDIEPEDRCFYENYCSKVQETFSELTLKR